MKQTKIKFIIFLFIFTYVFSFFPMYADDIDPDTSETQIVETSVSNEKIPKVNSRSCIVLDRTSKQVLYNKNSYNKVKMASTTKIMTSIVIIENFDLNTTVEATKKAAGTGGSRLGLKTGDKITINDLLYGLMLCSGNDAAVCLAETTCGSVENFCNLMNNKAQELGLLNTHFESPHGLDSDNHYTTAYELAILTDYALKNETFAKIVGTKNHTITINGRAKNLSNTNELLGNLNGVYGVKTGFTNGANRCLVTSCKRGNMDIICVVLGCDTKNFRTQDSIKLIEYAFKNFEYINIENLINEKFENWKKDNLFDFNINKGISSDIGLNYSKLEYPVIAVNKEDINSIDISFNITKTLDAPIYEGQVIGYFDVTINNHLFLTKDVVSTINISKKSFIDYLYSMLKNYSNYFSYRIFKLFSLKIKNTFIVFFYFI